MIMAAKIARITKLVQPWDEVLGRRALTVPASWRCPARPLRQSLAPAD
jgi:hypothetical protein